MTLACEIMWLNDTGKMKSSKCFGFLKVSKKPVEESLSCVSLKEILTAQIIIDVL